MGRRRRRGNTNSWRVMNENAPEKGGHFVSVFQRPWQPEDRNTSALLWVKRSYENPPIMSIGVILPLILVPPSPPSQLILHYVHTLCTHPSTNTHTRTCTHSKKSKSKKQSVSLPLSGHAIWHSQNARALSGPLSQCNATSWSRARNSQVD